MPVQDQEVSVSLLLYKVSKWIQGKPILDRISFAVPEGCFASILGPSGSGKSTLLRVIAGLDRENISGSIWFNRQNYTHYPSQARQLGFVFQTCALFPRQTVRANLLFGFRYHPVDQAEINARLDSVLEALRIRDLLDHYPHQLSGGQMQRIALARSLIVEPPFLLLDEPFRALDSELRSKVSQWLKAYVSDKHITTLMITHDTQEAMLLSDEILVLREGRLVQQGSPSFIYNNPINVFVGEFLGPLMPPSVRIWPKVPLRSHEVVLTRTPSPNSIIVILESLLYKTQTIDLTLSSSHTHDTFVVELGYKRFAALDLEQRTTVLYLRSAL